MTRVKRLPIGTICLCTPTAQPVIGPIERLFVHDKRSNYGRLYYNAGEATFHNQLVRTISYSGNDYLIQSLTTNKSCWTVHQFLTPISFKEL